MSTVYWGVDCGSTEIKVAACDASGKVLQLHKQRTLFPLADHVTATLTTCGKAGCPVDPATHRVLPGHAIAITGSGRAHVDFIGEKLTEIKAHFLGVHSRMADRLPTGKPYVIIDIGGQDSKVIQVRDNAIESFVLNRKCAAGTGAFIEEIAHRLELKLSDLTELDKKHDRDLTLNSFCTVFAGTEVIRILMNGERVENLIHALYESVVKRVLEMTAITTDTIVFSGGVLAFHPALHEIFCARLAKDRQYHLAPDAQFSGAIGAVHHLLRKGVAT